ncbi:MAG: zinc-binding dehydrogenase [Chloroflexi bacterium]|nr:zinc-binding dehydrogenase [Chloroflexota bacterium]
MGPPSDYKAVMELVFAGKLNPIIDTEYPLNEGLTALHRLHDNDVTGKLVLTL